MSGSSGSNHASAEAGRRANGESSPTKSPACFSNDRRTAWSCSLVVTVVAYENCGMTRSPRSSIERGTSALCCSTIATRSASVTSFLVSARAIAAL